MTGGVGAQRVSSVVKPGEQASLEYQFRPDSMLQVREFQVAVHVFYQVSPPAPPLPLPSSPSAESFTASKLGGALAGLGLIRTFRLSKHEHLI